jgi:hypothetical protein
MSLLNAGTLNVTKGGLGFDGTSNNTGGYDIKMTGGSINLDLGAQLLGSTGNGYIQTGGAFRAKGSTPDSLITGGDIKFNGGTVTMGDGSNTYNTLKLSSTVGAVYIDGATFTFKVNAAMSGQCDLLDIRNGDLHIDKNGGSSTMQWTINGTPANGTWTVIQVDNGHNIDGDFTTKNIPAGFSENKTSKWNLTRP